MADGAVGTEAAGTKRPCRDSADQPVFHGELGDLLAKHLEQQQQLVSGMLASSSQGTTKLLSDFVASSEERFRKQDEKIGADDARCSNIEATQNAVQAEMQELKDGQTRLEEQLRLANSNVLSREDVASDKFDRPPDLSIIRVSSKKFATKVAVENAITPWLTNAGVSRDLWSLSGNTTGKKFRVHFLQNPLSSARLVEECLAALKDENGTWTEIYVTLVNKTREKLFISPDESPKAETQRRMAKSLLRVLAEDYAHVEEVHFRKNKASVFAGKVGIAIMQPTGPNPSRDSFLWNLKGVEELGLERGAILTKTLSYLASPEDQIHWCV